jgi:hypothetical protein
MPRRMRERGPLTELQRENLKNLERNSSNGTLSKKAMRRLINSVNWLIAAAPKKKVYSKELRKSFNFKVNFITLTLPGETQMISDHKFKKVLIHNFINTARYRWNLKNFVWKVETQKNGKIHAHFLTDTFIDYRSLRKVWNTILDKNNLLSEYQFKHQNLTFNEYNNLYNPDNKKEIAKVKKAYYEGVKSNWSNPNSTDVKALKNDKNIAGYMAKYMAKNEDSRRKIKGRIWSCSYSIAQANKLSVDIPYAADFDSLESFFSKDIEYHEIHSNPENPLLRKKVGEIFFLNHNKWMHTIKGKIQEVYKTALFNIRNCIDFDAFKEVIDTSINTYKYTPPEVVADFIGVQLECPF